MNQYNRISVFASDAEAVTAETHSPDKGYYYTDTVWSGLEDRMDGAREGIAYSINYNTAIRQATTMASVLADALAARNEESNAYQYMNANGIGSTFVAEQETDMENHITNLANIMSKNNFLMTNEVTTPKINAQAVTTEKIANNAVTQAQLGNVITASGTASTQSTINGMTIRLYQDNNIGPLKVELTGNAVTNANNSNITTASASSHTYITGVKSTSGYNSLQINPSVYFQGGNMYASSFITAGYVQASYFNATSDIRKKKDIKNLINTDVISDIVENTDIVTFKYLDSEDVNFGIIAQQIENKNIDGFSLVQVDKDGYLQIRENKLVYVLWEYVKLLNEKIKKLES